MLFDKSMQKTQDKYSFILALERTVAWGIRPRMFDTSMQDFISICFSANVKFIPFPRNPYQSEISLRVFPKQLGIPLSCIICMKLIWHWN